LFKVIINFDSILIQSDHAEARTILDGSQQFLAQNVFAGVAGNNQLVKAGVR
jgi:hypothetical protein